MLETFTRHHDFLVGIDSDGCAFDTMEIKHKECFIPNIIKFYGLQAVSKYARETAEFINLYSKWRGINRFPGLVMALDLLRERSPVQVRKVDVPQLPGLRAWLERETKLGMPALRAEVQKTNDPDLKVSCDWSQAVNDEIADMVHDIPPFPYVRESLQKLSSKADMIVCSATPNEALEKEWQEHDIAKFVSAICGQEVGSKKESLAATMSRGYDKSRVLMIGDALGDLNAAKAVGALFYPINPGDEDASWKRFHDEACDKFLNGKFAGEYEAGLISEFQTYLPEVAPWQK